MSDAASLEKGIEDLARSVTTLAGFEKGSKPSDAVKAGREALTPELIEHAQFYQKHRAVLKGAFNADGGLKTDVELGEAAGKIKEAAKDAKMEVDAFSKRFLEAKTALGKVAGSEVDTQKALISNVEKAGKRLGGMGGMIENEGWVGAIQKNMLEHQGRPFKMGGRWAIVGLGSVGVLDGVFRNQTTDGDRSIVTRFGEIAVCGAAVAAALLASKAKVHVPA